MCGAVPAGARPVRRGGTRRSRRGGWFGGSMPAVPVQLGTVRPPVLVRPVAGLEVPPGLSSLPGLAGVAVLAGVLRAWGATLCGELPGFRVARALLVLRPGLALALLCRGTCARELTDADLPPMAALATWPGSHTRAERA